MKFPNQKPELMVPAGNKAMLAAAIHSGADAVYFGIDKFNMRAAAKKFTSDQLPELVSTCHQNGVKAYLTVNSIVYNDEMEDVKKVLIQAREAGIDLVICWDLGVIGLCNELDIPFCMSTQASLSNINAVKMAERLGAKRVVLARECSMDDLYSIRQQTPLEVEVFIHGAMCISVSGRCFLSHEVFGQSANRGACIQNCRREYEVKLTDQDGGHELILGTDYVLSPKDLCSLPFLDDIIASGVHSLKIEGRKRSPEYVAVTTSVYRKAIDAIYEGAFTLELINSLYEELKTVYNRGFSSGFFFEPPSSNDYTHQYGNISPFRKIYAGKVDAIDQENHLATIKMEADSIFKTDSIYIISESSGVRQLPASQLLVSDEQWQKGCRYSIHLDIPLEKGDQIYRIIKKNENIPT